MDIKTQQKSKMLMVGTMIYAIGNFGTKILSFLIVPLYTFYIAPAEMGDYELVITTVNLLTPFITLQISDAAYKWMLNHAEKNKSYITAVYKFIFCASIISSLLILTVNRFIHITYCYYFIGVLISGRWLESIKRLLRGLKNQKLFVTSGMMYTVIFLALNVLQIVVLKQGVAALFQSAIIANCITLLFVFICEKRLRTFDFKDKSLSTQLKFLKFSVPLVPNRLNWWVMSSLDRYIIKWFLGGAANGIYAIAYKFPSLFQLIFNIFYDAWQDMAVADKDENPSAFYTGIFRLYYRLSFSFLLLLIPATKLVINLVMSESYRTAAAYTSFLYLGTVFQAFSSFYGVGYMRSGKTTQAALTSILGAIVNALVNLVFIKYIGLHAASISTFIGFFVMYIVRAIQTKASMQIKVNKPAFVILFCLALTMAIISIITDTITDLVLLGVGITVFTVVNFKDIKLLVKQIMNKFHLV